MRVLVVEDERLLSTVLTDFLRELGHQPVVVGSAEAGLEVIERDPPDIVLLDIKLPGISGIDFMRLAPVRESGVPVIVMSGVATDSQAREALAIGALDFIAKPVPFERLSDMLDLAGPLAPEPGRVKPTKPDRRPARRAKISLPVSISLGHEAWSGKCYDLSVSGMKVWLEQAPRRGAIVHLTMALPDGAIPVDTQAKVVRVDADGAAFWFLDLGAAAEARISTLVASTLAGTKPRPRSPRRA